MAEETPGTKSVTTTEDPNKALRGGIRCPECLCPHHSVTQTRISERNFNGKRREYILRWRQCRYCGCTFKTREVVEPELPDEVKSPAQAKQVEKKLTETLGNILPPTKIDIPDLKNPFL